MIKQHAGDPAAADLWNELELGELLADMEGLQEKLRGKPDQVCNTLTFSAFIRLNSLSFSTRLLKMIHFIAENKS